MTASAVQVRRAVASTLAFRRWRWLFYLLALVIEGFALVLVAGRPEALVLLPVLAIPTWIPFRVLGRYRLPDEELEDRHFASQLKNLRSCFGTNLYYRHRHSREEDPRQKKIRIVTARSHRGLRGKSAFLAIHAYRTSLYVTPRSYWVQRRGQGIAYGDVTAIGIDVFSFIDRVERPRSDDEVVGSTWYHATKRGERDLRYRDNWELWMVRRYVVELAFGNDRWAINAYSEDNAHLIANSFSAISKQGPVLTFDDDADEPEYHPDEEAGERDEEDADEPYQPPRQAAEPPPTWYEVLAVSPDASVADIKKAHRERIMQYHPDRVAHLGEKLRVVAEQEAVAINDAYAQAMTARR